VIGSLQALEAIKLVTGTGRPLIGRLLLFDGLKLQFREIELTKDPDCVVCGTHPTVTRLIDYEAFCGVGAPVAANGEISASEAERARGDDRSVVLLDVREPFEWDIVHVDGARHVPLRELPARLGELDGHAQVLVYCHHGTRSRQAVELLKAAGFAKARSVRGGIDAWAVEADPSLVRY
jgi:adenylyltransferase/sulfurtransferase